MAITKISAAMTDLDGAVTINESSADVDFRVESNGDANMLFVDGGNNRVLIGTAASRAMSGVTPNLFIEGNSGYNDSSLGLVVNSNSTGEIPTLLFGRSRGTSDGAVTILQSGDRIASIRAHGADGTDFEQSAAIEFYVDATPGANEVPGRIGFYTTTDGSQYLTEKMRIDNAGKVGIGVTPTSLLHIDGGASNTYLTVEANSGVSNAIKFVGANTWYLGNDTGQGIGDNNFALLDGSTKVIDVDNAGHVTMPLQPAFSTYLSSSQTDVAVGSAVTVTFNN